MMTTQEAAQHIREALAAAVCRDAERATDLIAGLITGSDANGLHGVCCGIAVAGLCRTVIEHAEAAG